MPKRAVTPSEFRAAAEQLRMSPAILSGGFAFLTGVTGGDAQGQIPEEACPTRARPSGR
ncbi:hypothetical protein [Bosea sp. Tri-44]|uniref:hypothetical protein n=1 Tax=Bosea sp. Tri-44 TaxID=1972137 RepID=UPI0013E91159|nr:hypothetical protein [Bosea sp. Tri-44]